MIQVGDRLVSNKRWRRWVKVGRGKFPRVMPTGVGTVVAVYATSYSYETVIVQWPGVERTKIQSGQWWCDKATIGDELSEVPSAQGG